MPISQSTPAGRLYVIATPIGNRDDITLRALKLLAEVDAVAAEDTRHSGRLLAAYGITRPLISLHEHNEAARIDGLLRRLATGQSLALISDAGTPLISDPGYRLVRAVRDAGHAVIPIPGPSALTAALCASGLPTDRFVFEGFLSARAGARRQRLQELAVETRTLVFYESVHRLVTTLEDMADAMGGNREAVVARELTKQFEEFRLQPLGRLAADWAIDEEHRRGEFVILVHGAEASEKATQQQEAMRIMAVLQEALPPGKAATLTARLTGLSKQALYRAAHQDDT